MCEPDATEYTWSTAKRCKQITLVLFRLIPRMKFPDRQSISIGTGSMFSYCDYLPAKVWQIVTDELAKGGKQWQNP